MELRQLRYFLKVAETLNFSEASRELFVSQSTLSQQIGQLECEFGQQLFQRNSHEVILTEAGETLMPLARETVNASEVCKLRLQELDALQVGELKIGVTHSFSSIVTETLMEFMKRYPKVKVSVIYMNMEVLMEKLLGHELDFVLAFKPNRKNERIESHVLFNNHLAAIVSEGHQLASKKSVRMDELSKYGMVLPHKGLQARNAFERMIEHSDCQFQVKAEFNNVSVLLQIVRESNYVTVLSESAILGEDGVKAVILDVDNNDMEGCIHNLKDAYIKQSAKTFIQMLMQSTSMLKSSFLLNL